jgi:anti-sigma regulatory factor (Ser/Thr protein kinase)
VTTTQLSFELAGGPYAPTAARLAVDGLDVHLDSVLLNDLRLLVSEVISNSVRHAGVGAEDSLELEVAISDDTVRVAVTDPGAGFEPESPSPDLDDVSGWGLYLVEQLSDRWGVAREKGTRVWFEISRPQHSGAGNARAA